MNGIDSKSDPRPCGDDVAAYALGALDPVEADAFRAHLETCAVCRDELTAFEAVVEVLPMTATQQRAPKGLRRQVLDAVRHEPKLELRAQRRRPALPFLARLSMPRPALALGAAVAVLAIAVGVELGNSGGVKTRVYAAQVTGGGRAELAITGSHAELIVHRLSPPPSGQIYEVWLGRPGQPPAPTTALFSVTSKGEADVEVPGSLKGVKLVMVTPEPAGGSRVPTHPAVIRAQLS